MKIKSLFLITFLFIIYFVFNSFSYAKNISDNLENNIFRLRIVANSNSTEDQELKLKIRDNILNYLFKFNFSNKSETISYLNSHKSDIENIISKTIKENNFNYSFSFEISNSFYPKKNYNSIILPSGNYDGLQIKIGNAKGQNWWCILFPPMCLINSSTCQINKQLLSDNLSDETVNIITTPQNEYKLKFKILDFLNSL